MSEHLRHQIAALSKIVDQLKDIVNQREQQNVPVPVLLNQSNSNQFNESIFEEDTEVPQIMFESSDMQPDVSLDIFHALPTFDGEKKQYRQWRSMVTTAMTPLINQQTTMRHYEALLIIRKKIVGPASTNAIDIKFDFVNMINQLDLAYFDDDSEQEQTLVIQPSDSGNDEPNLPNVFAREFSESRCEELYEDKYEQNHQSEALLSTQRKKTIQRTNRVNDKSIAEKIWTIKVFWDYKCSSKRQVKPTQIALSFLVIFMNVKSWIT